MITRIPLKSSNRVKWHRQRWLWAQNAACVRLGRSLPCGEGNLLERKLRKRLASSRLSFGTRDVPVHSPIVELQEAGHSAQRLVGARARRSLSLLRRLRSEPTVCEHCNGHPSRVRHKPMRVPASRNLMEIKAVRQPCIGLCRTGAEEPMTLLVSTLLLRQAGWPESAPSFTVPVLIGGERRGGWGAEGRGEEHTGGIDPVRWGQAGGRGGGVVPMPRTGRRVRLPRQALTRWNAAQGCGEIITARLSKC